jgi:exonuclease III
VHSFNVSTVSFDQNSSSIFSSLCDEDGKSLSSFKCLYTNAQSLVNKLEEFENLVFEHHPMIVGITETRGRDDVLDGLLSLSDFHPVFRKDRVGKRGGGVCMWIHNSLKVTPRDDLTNLNFEDSVWCQISLENQDTLLVGTVYRSPSSSDENNTALLDLLDRVDKDKHSHLLVMGDFNNYTDVDFINCSCSASELSQSSKFLDKTQELLLVQHMDRPTRFRDYCEPSMPDLVFTNARCISRAKAFRSL